MENTKPIQGKLFELPITVKGEDLMAVLKSRSLSPSQRGQGGGEDYIYTISEKAERRFSTGTITFLEIETNGTKTVDENKIMGYAAVFNKDSEDFGGWVERIAPGSFDGVIKDESTFALFNHSMNQVLGRNMVNVSLSVDDVGLRYEVNMPDTNLAQDVRKLVKANIINKSSFAFTVAEESFTKGDPSKGTPHIRTITKIERLYDVSPVTVPAYPDTSVAARSFKREIAKEEIQQALMSPLELRLLIHLSENKLKHTSWKRKF